MPPKKGPEAPASASKGSKRKEHPSSSSNGPNTQNRARAAKRVKLWDARSILTQTTDAALNNGELDLQAFLKSREFEIKALQDGMERSKSGLTTRAFQQVPRDMRRRTASHNVKRVPSRLQKRAKREMNEDNTPGPKVKKGGSRGRIRAETAKRLGILAEKKKKEKAKAGIETRPARMKIRRDILNDPPKPKSKFRKRQINKTWLPTHMWLAKRATMTEPKNPLWRFALPFTSTEKSYRPTHRAGGARGCVAWDMSYVSTIALEGRELSLMKVLKGMGVTEKGVWEKKGEKWRQGKRSWTGWLSRKVTNNIVQICPATIFWCPAEQISNGDEMKDQPPNPPKRKLYIRIHPSAFMEAWNEILRLSKEQRPVVHAEDLRFEIGSIEITGPGCTEALLGILHPFINKDETKDQHAEAFTSLAGVSNPSSLPANSLLSFNIFDPRLYYPPRPVQLPNPNDEESTFKLLETLSSWPVDASTGSAALFDRDLRYKATWLPSQKALNRRKSQARPGDYASITNKDPPIPITLLTSKPTSSSSSAAQGTWILLAPWKCILPIWHGIVHYPLSSGGNPRFGGLDELRQLHFEHGTPWFPADYPGTAAGFTWESEERIKRKLEWERRPKGKRVEWGSLDLGAGRKGEIGRGWAADFEHIAGSSLPAGMGSPMTQDTSMTDSPDEAPPPVTDNTPKPKQAEIPPPPPSENPLTHLPLQAFNLLLSKPPSTPLPPLSSIATIRITLTTSGVAKPCARIYRLPSTPSKRAAWLSLLPTSPQHTPKQNPKSKNTNTTLPPRLPLNIPLPKRIRLLAQTLLQTPAMPYPPVSNATPEETHPLVPDEDDLVGFVTTGCFNLAEGKGVCMGGVCVRMMLEGGEERKGEGRLCIVRNAGEAVGRLGRWEGV